MPSLSFSLIKYISFTVEKVKDAHNDEHGNNRTSNKGGPREAILDYGGTPLSPIDSRLNYIEYCLERGVERGCVVDRVELPPHITTPPYFSCG